VDVSPSGGGTVEVDEIVSSSFPVTSSFSNGTSVSLKAVPTSGYNFNNWSGDLFGTTNPTTIVMGCNKKITANFYQIRHSLTKQVSGNGTTTPILGDHDYIEGSVVNITANPDIGWQFDRWTGDVSDPNAASTTVIMNSEKTIIASFSRTMHTLTIRLNGSGSTTPTAGNHDYVEGTVVSIEAIPSDGWQFDRWTGDASDPNSATTTVTMGSDKTLTAIFSKVKLNWWLIGGITGGAVTGCVGYYLVVRKRIRLRSKQRRG
jgi:uncharacterized repeat protein (TIGR02543 family)